MPETSETINVLILADIKNQDAAEWLRNEFDGGRFSSDITWITETGIDKDVLASLRTQYQVLLIVLSEDSWPRIKMTSQYNFQQLQQFEGASRKIISLKIDGLGDTKYDTFHKEHLSWINNANPKTKTHLQKKIRQIKNYLVGDEANVELEVKNKDNQPSNELKAEDEPPSQAIESDDKLQLAKAQADRAKAVNKKDTWQQALQYLNDAVENSKTDHQLLAEFLTQRANTLLDAGRLEEAHSDYVEVLRIKPDDLSALNGYKKALLGLGWPPEGIAGVPDDRRRSYEAIGKVPGVFAGVNSVAFSPDGENIASASLDKTARVWRVASGTEVFSLNHPSAALSVIYSPSGQQLATACFDASIRIWDGVSGREIQRFIHDDAVRSICYSPDGKYLASASEDRTVRIWNLETGEEVERLQHGNWVLHVTYSPDGNYLASASLKEGVRIWDLNTNQQTILLSGSEDVNSVIFGATSHLLATSDYHGSIRLWNATSGEAHAFSKHDASATSLAIDSDGRFLASASKDGTARLWNLSSGEEISCFTHVDWVSAVAFSPNGEYVATACNDYSARLWSIKTSECLRCFNHSEGYIPEDITETGTILANNAGQPSRIGNKEYFSNDQASDVDKLGFTPYVEAFADLIAAPRTGTPLTIGILGEWGSGKSTLMNLLCDELVSRGTKERFWNHHFRCLYPHAKHYVWITSFNAWTLSSCKAVWPALVREVMRTVTGHWGWEFQLFFTRVGRDISKSLKSPKSLMAFYTVLLACIAVVWFPDQVAALGRFVNLEEYLGSLIKVGAFTWFGISVIKTAISAAASPFGNWFTRMFDGAPYGENIEHMEDIDKDLRFLGRKLTSSKSRILVKVDDLDRCEPDKAVEMLQAIKLLLDFSGVVVILGIDARVITAAIDHYYRDVFDKAGISGHEYLEKIVQVPFRIPRASNQQIKNYIADVMRSGEVNESAVDIHEMKQSSGSTSSVEGSVTGLPSAISQDSIHHANSNPLQDMDEQRKHVSRVNDIAGKTSLITHTSKTQIEQVDMGFSDDEIEAFTDHANFLEHNPRHIKRLRNIYLLVRSLVHRKGVPGVLNKQRQFVRWLVICTQWPYVSSMMIQYFRRREEILLGNGSGRTPLRYLFNAVKDSMDVEQLALCDSSLLCLEELIDEREDAPDWELIRVLWPLTINFNLTADAVITNDGNGREAENPKQVVDSTRT